MIRFDPTSEAFFDALARDLRAQYPDPEPVERPVWSSAALRVVDCALAVAPGGRPLALRGTAYAEGVAPRVDAFARAHPAVQSVADLRAFIASNPSPEAFARDTLGADPQCGVAVRALAGYLAEKTNGAADERARLAEWAIDAIGESGDFYDGDDLIREEGFLYLRRLFGAPVALPGPYADAWASETARGPVVLMPEEALAIAAERAGLPLASVEQAVRRDHLAGRAWGERPESPEAGAWVVYMRALAAAARRSWTTGEEIAALVEAAPRPLPGAKEARRGDLLGAANALCAFRSHAGYGPLAASVLHALYDVALGRPMDAEVRFEAAHEAATEQIRALPADAGDAFRRSLLALAEAAGARIHVSRRQAP